MQYVTNYNQKLDDIHWYTICPCWGIVINPFKKGFSTHITFGFPFGFPLPSGSPAGFSGSFVFVCQLGWETANKLEKSCESLGGYERLEWVRENSACWRFKKNRWSTGQVPWKRVVDLSFLWMPWVNRPREPPIFDHSICLLHKINL